MTAGIKVVDIDHVRFTAPDLDRMAQFGKDFGLEIAAREEGRLFLRGTDPSPYCHVTELGEPGFLGMAFRAASADDLAKAATLDGASPVEKIDAPGGGERVRFTDPDGNTVDVIHGQELPPSLPVKSAEALNQGSVRRRKGTLQRIAAGPAQVKRLGHAVVRVADYPTSSAWYRSRFGFVSSDDVYLSDPNDIKLSFLRCDLGDDYTDHHTLLTIGLGEPGFDHAAFEVEDFDAVMSGHEHLRDAGYDHKAGIGRHVLGSQVFDYWNDPWGHTVEHFTDGDLLNAAHEPGRFDPAVALGTQWGKFGG